MTMKSKKFDLCDLSDLTETLCHVDDYFIDSNNDGEGFRTPPTLTPQVESPPTFVFKSEPITVFDMDSFDSDLLIPLPEALDEDEDEDMTESGAITPKLLPRFKTSSNAENIPLDHLCLPSLADTVSSVMDQNIGEGVSDSPCNSYQMGEAPPLPGPDSSSSSQEGDNDMDNNNNNNNESLTLRFDKDEPLAKKPLSATSHRLNHPISPPTNSSRRKSLGAFAA